MAVLHAFALIAVLYGSSAYIFTSVQKTLELVEVESDMLVELGNYINDASKNGLEVPETIVTFYENSLTQNKMATESSSFIENPINSLHFMKRLKDGWGWLVSLLGLEESEEIGPLTGLKEQLSVMWTEYGVSPSNMEVEMRGVYTGLHRLQQTYQLDIKQLIQGRILDEESHPLAPEDVLSICKVLDEKDEFVEQIRWLVALRSTMDDTSPGMTLVVRELASVLWKTEQYNQVLSLLTEQQTKDPSNKKLQRDLQFYENKLNDVSQSDTPLSLAPEPTGIYEALCRGEGERSIETTSSLRCIYRHTSIPIYMAKEEILSIIPRISIVYNVTYESEQTSIQQYASIKMHDSTTSNSDGSGQVSTHVRVSQTGIESVTCSDDAIKRENMIRAWFEDYDRPEFYRLSRRIQLITGLSTQSSPIRHCEPLQVLNYGLGGMYVPHLDVLNASTLQRSGDTRGDRMATWMFYLKDVKAGGATVFPVLNVTVPVTKGAAAFWYNINRNGESDLRLSHAGCPVLLGSKWGSGDFLTKVRTIDFIINMNIKRR